MATCQTADSLPETAVLDTTANTRTSPQHCFDQLLRNHSALLSRIHEGTDLTSLARTMIITITIAAAAFGATLGVYRGGIQILFAAIKLPMVILLTAAVCTPALTALRRVVVGHSSLLRDVTLVLCALALGTVLLAALAPLLILSTSWGASYHELILVTVGCCLIAGGAGLRLLFLGLKDLALGARAIVGMTLIATFALVGMQMSWTLRPYLVRPRSPHVPFIRSLEGSFSQAVFDSINSSRGDYYRLEAPLPGQTALEATHEAH